MTVGFVYCLENRCMPGICKIGMTERSPTQRCNELSNSTSSPVPFEILFYVEVDNAAVVERELHEAFVDARVNCYREFFTCSPLAAYEWLRCYADTYTEFISAELLFLMSKPTLSLVEGGN